MTLFNAIVTPLAAALLFLYAYAFAPIQGNLLGDAAILGIPLWLGTLALALGTAAVAVDAILRRVRRPR